MPRITSDLATSESFAHSFVRLAVYVKQRFLLLARWPLQRRCSQQFSQAFVTLSYLVSNQHGRRSDVLRDITGLIIDLFQLVA